MDNSQPRRYFTQRNTSLPPKTVRSEMSTIVEDLDQKEQEQRRLSVMHEKKALIDAILTMESSGSMIKSNRPGGFTVNLLNSKLKG